jgi:hypothetical protein
MTTILCHVVWMPKYDGEDEFIAGGFKYPRINGGGHELFNFRAIDKKCYGYVQPVGGRTINIDKLGALRTDETVDDVTVIWTASNANNLRLIVGWYRNATVHRNQDRKVMPKRFSKGEHVGFYIEAMAKDCTLLFESERTFSVPHHRPGGGFPGHSSVYFADGSPNPDFKKWLRSAISYIDDYDRDITEAVKTRPASHWPLTPDAARNAAVEAAAIKAVETLLGPRTRDRQKDNCGWDLEFKVKARTLCVEVKGLSGATINAALTTNEYKSVRDVVAGKFSGGDYRLAVVTNALSSPQVHIFAHLKDDIWRCEQTHIEVRCVEAGAANFRP